jgi:DNA-directed RNA polymerase subunit RPC12/RpoP
MTKKARPRSLRREGERALTKLQSANEKLFLLEPGGSEGRPLDVASAAVIEAHAESVPCPRCGGRHDVEEHLALTLAGARLRQVRLRCRQCGSRRSVWFRIAEPKPN